MLRSVGFQSVVPDVGFVNLARDAYKGDMTTLFDDGEAVERLLSQPGMEIVARLVALEVESLDAMLNGRLLDSRAEYARLTGRRGGLGGFLAAAHAIVAEASKKREEQARKHEATAGSVAA